MDIPQNRRRCISIVLMLTCLLMLTQSAAAETPDACDRIAPTSTLGTVDATNAYYYFFSQKVAITPLSDQLAIGFETGLTETEQATILSAYLPFSEIQFPFACKRFDAFFVSLPRDGITGELADLCLKLKLHPKVLFASQVYRYGQQIRFAPTDHVLTLMESEKLRAEQVRAIEVLGLEHVASTDGCETFRCSDSDANALDIANHLVEAGLTDHAEPDFLYVQRRPALAVHPADADIPTLSAPPLGWHLDKTLTREAWRLLGGVPDHSVRVAVLDDGVWGKHPDLAANMHNAGYNALHDREGANAGQPENSESWHGTAVAGVIAAREGNNLGPDGVSANKALIMSVVVMTLVDDDQYVGTTASLAKGIQWSCDNGAAVLSGSLSGPPSGLTMSKLTIARNGARGGLGALPIFGSGNARPENWSTSVMYPASFEATLAVGASDPADSRCRHEGIWESCYGAELDIVAPGERVYTTDGPGRSGGGDDDYCSLDMTSSACPQVAAVAALILAVKPGLRATEVQSIIQRTADRVGDYDYGTRSDRFDNGSDGWNEEMGYGRLNALRAVAAVRSPSSVQAYAQDTSDQAQLVVTWPDRPDKVVYSNDSVTLQNGQATSPLVLAGVAPGSYDFYLKTDHGLRRRKLRQLPSAGQLTVDFTEGNDPLHLGDANGDNEVNLLDFAEWMRAYQATLGRANLQGAGHAADFDGDGAIDLSDFMVWWRTYDCVLKGGCQGDGWKGTKLASDEWVPLPGWAPAEASAAAPQHSLAVGETITIPVTIDTHGLPTQGASLCMHYDSGVFLAQDQRPDREGIQVTLGDLYTDAGQNKVDPVSGTICVSAYSTGDESFCGGGTLFTVTLTATAAISHTEITFDYLPGRTVGSHIVSSGESGSVLGTADPLAITVTGSPARPMPVVSIQSPLHAVRDSHALVQVLADDPHNQVRSVEVWAFQDGAWHRLGTDADGSDGWGIEWDATFIEDQAVRFRAFAALPGGLGAEAVSDDVFLDRMSPVFVQHSFSPPSPSTAPVVDISVSAQDATSWVERIEAFVNVAADGSTDGAWHSIGHIGGATGTIEWDTQAPLGSEQAPLTHGMHRIIFEMTDVAGNSNLWLGQDLPDITYCVGCHPSYLPLMIRQPGPYVLLEAPYSGR